MVRALCICWIACGALAAHAQDAGPVDAGPRTLTLQPSSSLVVRTFKDGARATLTHDHVVKATEIAGEATWDPAAPESLKLKVTVQTKSLLVDDPAERARFGLTDAVSDKDKKAVDEALKGRDTLDARRYPTLSFRSTRTTRAADGALVMTGDFTMHGVTRSVSLPVVLEPTADGVIGTGTLSLKTSDFGIRPYSAFLGAIKVKDEVEIHLRLVGAAK
jgi:polyisoprenoid-binding protein YceI